MSEDHELEQEEHEEELRLDPELEARRRAAMSFIRRLGDPVLKSRATPWTASTTRSACRWPAWAGSWATPSAWAWRRRSWACPSGCWCTAWGPMRRWWRSPTPSSNGRATSRRCSRRAASPFPASTSRWSARCYVRVSALDENGTERRVEASGLEARVIQHEMDHLDGVLILDRTSKEQRKEAMRALREPDGEAEAA